MEESSVSKLEFALERAVHTALLLARMRRRTANHRDKN